MQVTVENSAFASVIGALVLTPGGTARINAQSNDVR
jgi:hypothetical protein